MIERMNIGIVAKIPSNILRGYTAQRLLTACLVFTSALFSAWVLGPTLYGQVFLVMFIAKLLLLGNLGSISGYMHGFYNAKQTPLSSGAFVLSYGLHLLLFSAAAIAIGFFLDKVYFLGAICFALLLPFFVVEPVLRVKREFYVSLLPDWALNLSLLLGLFYCYLGGFLGMSLEAFIKPFLFFLGFLSFVFILWINWRWDLVRRFNFARPMFNYIDLVKIGFPLFAGTAAFSLFLFIDRFFLERYHSAESLGTYMLAFQLATGATLILTSLNFIAGVDYGDLIKQKRPLGVYIAQRLRQALFVSIFSIILLLAGAFTLQQHFFQEYHGLTLATLFLGVGLCGFYTAGSITPVAFYLNKQKFLMVAMFVVVLLSILGNFFVVSSGVGYIWISGFSAFWLLIYAGFSIVYVLAITRSSVALAD